MKHDYLSFKNTIESTGLLFSRTTKSRIINAE